MKYTLFFASLSLIAALLNACSAKQSTQALGILERDRILLKATAAEIITATPISEGTNVNEGDLLVQLDDTHQKIQLAKADANLASAHANLLKLRHGARAEDIAASRAQVTRAESQLLEAQKSFDRAATLVNKKLAGAADLDGARAKRDAAAADLDRAKQTLLALTNGTRDEDIQQAEAQVAQALAAQQLEQCNLNELSIRATRNGRLDRLPKNRGERTNIGDPLAIILADAAPYARVYIPETARAAIRNGQLFRVHVDGVKNSIDGTLRWIAQDPAFTPYYALNSVDRSRLVYLAEIQLPPSAEHLPNGIPVQVDLPLQK